MTNYQGNGAYCYANGGSMLLASIGETVSPSLLEVASGFSLGASLVRHNLLHFDQATSSPDQALNHAFHHLGFQVTENVKGNDASMPIDELTEALKNGPALLGPLDMGMLTYLPNHPFLHGCDHYVLAIKIEGDRLLLHDPAGYPYVWFPITQLENAWRAKSITWSSGAYRYWTSPKRMEDASDGVLAQRLLSFYEEIYRRHQKEYQSGSAIIYQKATDMKRDLVSMAEKEHLRHFAFPVGARRALDFSQFFQQSSPTFSSLKKAQAEIFGECYTYASYEDWGMVGERLEKLSEVEEEIERLFGDKAES
ncbi:hypothetical protein ACQKJC_00780 [Priestia koreensis]|uniref:hypothetical protein n=1 Tax=Priestia koreensis TaxID=284581 RepID=UPI003D0718A4